MRIYAVLGLVLAPSVAGAAVIRVGPHGTHATVQAGLDAVAAVPGSHEVRVETGTYRENVENYDCCAGRVTVSGGWDPTFAVRSASTPSVVDGGGLGSTMQLHVWRGEMRLVSLVVRNGLVDDEGSAAGAGMRLSADGDARLELSSLDVRSNTIQVNTSPGYGQGAGAYLWLAEHARASVLNCSFTSNAIVEGTGGRIVSAYGGGLRVVAYGKSFVELRRNRFAGNGLRGSGWLGGGGLAVFADSAELAVRVEESDFEANRLIPLGVGGSAVGAGADFQLYGSGTLAIVEARRLRLLANRGGAAQATVNLTLGGRMLLSDSVAALGDGGGFRLRNAFPAKVLVTNLTAVQNDAIGIEALGSDVSLHNSLAFGNGTDLDLSPLTDSSFNLEGVDPGFVPGSLYVIGADSPARDAGTNTPPGGLGPLDVDRGPRVVSGTVDIGADEFKP